MSEWAGLGGLTGLFARGRGQLLARVLRVARAVADGRCRRRADWSVRLAGGRAFWPSGSSRRPSRSSRVCGAPSLPPRLAAGLLLTLFLMALTPAICEEALFRGPILRGLRARLSPAGAAILTGLLFGIYHLDSWRLLPTAILGVALSGIALASDSIVPAMVAHFVNNACLIAPGAPARRRHDALPTSTKLFSARSVLSSCRSGFA